MRIKALGGVGAVTGSSFQLSLETGESILLDCGLFQGGRQTELRNFNTQLYNPKKISAIVITHAHMDHSGLVPRLVKEGFRGPVYATEATCDLLRILWQDAAGIQEQEAIWKTRKNKRQGQKSVEPLYTEVDAEKAASLLTPLFFDRPREILPGLTVHMLAAGHILGAASVHCTVRENGAVKSVLFSGDIGRYNQLIMPDPQTPPPAETIFMETTYGSREHKPLEPSIKELIEAVNQAWRDRGKVLIPAFAVERTQEVLFLLSRAWHENTISRDMPIILDSPLATAASEIYTQHVNLFDEETKALLKRGISPQTVPNLRITREARESQKLNDLEGPAIIVAGSGMANAGRILHHLKHNLWRPECHVVFVGFQAQGTTGRRLVEGAQAVKIFRELVQVEAQIHTIGGFSGHADKTELLRWLRPQVHEGLTVNLIHGEPSSTQHFQELARTSFPEARFEVPVWLQYAALAQEETPAARPAALEQTAQLERSFFRRLERLRERAWQVKDLPPDQLALLESRLNEAEEIFMVLPLDEAEARNP